MIYAIIIGVAFVLFCNFNPKTEYQSSRWFIATLCAVWLLAYQVYLIAGIPLALLVGYYMSSASYYGMFTFQNHFTNNTAFKNIGLMREANKTLVSCMVFTLAFIYIDSEFIAHFVMAAPFILLLAAVSTFFPRIVRCEINGKMQDIKTHWFTGNISTGATFMSMIAMVSMIDPQPWTLPIIGFAFLAILKTRTSSGLGGMVAGMTAYYMIVSPVYAILCSMIVVSGLILLSKAHGNYSKMFYLSGRDKIVKDSFKFLYPEGSRLFGIGCGTYGFAFPLAQLKDKQNNLAVWMHCDIAQFFLEAGIVGALLAVTVLIGLFPMIIAVPAIAAFAACYLVNSTTNFPNHMSDTTFLLVLMLKFAYN